MLDLMLLVAAGLHQTAPTNGPESPQVHASQESNEAATEEIEVRGRRRICKLERLNSAESRLDRTRICLTAREWNQRRDEAVAFYDDIPRRNPRKGPSSTAGPDVPAPN